MVAVVHGITMKKKQKSKNDVEFDMFIICMDNLHKQFDVQDRLGEVLNIIAPSGTSDSEIFSESIDDYIKLMKYTFDDHYENIEWYVYELDWGKKSDKLHITTADKKEHTINNYEMLYKAIKDQL